LNLENLLVKGSSELGITLDSRKIQKFLSYHELIKKWNSKINLTSVTDDSEIIVKHFLDSLTVSELITDGPNILDIGTGAGFPGVPIAIVRESLNITVLDSRGKRIFFINEVLRELDLSNVKTVPGRAEDSNNGVPRINFDYVLTRAVGDIKEVINLSLPYLNEKGKIILMRGKEGKIEWERFKNNNLKLLHLREIIVPESNFMRVLLVLSQK
jgi:16S rRNA (guanine527-N7)-methyltransferase